MYQELPKQYYYEDPYKKALAFELYIARRSFVRTVVKTIIIPVAFFLIYFLFRAGTP